MSKSAIHVATGSNVPSWDAEGFQEVERMEPRDEVLTSDEAAHLLNVSRKTVLQHARLGEVPGAKSGRVWRFRCSELIGFVTSTRAAS